MIESIHKIVQGQPCHLDTIASATLKSQKHIRELSKNGHLPPMKKSVFPDGIETIQKYITYIESNGGDDVESKTRLEKLRKITAEADHKEALAKKHNNSVIETDIVETILSETGAYIRSNLISSIPKIVQDLKKCKDDYEREKVIISSVESVLNYMSENGLDKMLSIQNKKLITENAEEDQDEEED